jgi:CBS domain-containing protein/Flp pilus assembly pilin Flp
MQIVRQFRDDHCGAAHVEYAMFLGAVLGALLLVTDSLSLASRRVFTRLSSFSAATHSSGDSERRVAPTRPTNVSPSELVDEEVRQHHWGALRIVLLTGLGVVTIVGYRALRRESRAHAEREAEFRAGQQAASVTRAARFVSKRQQLMRFLSGRPDILLDGRMLVKHLMTGEVVAARPSATVAELMTTMAREDVRHLMICGKGEELLGVVSDRDLRAPMGKRAADLMTNSPTTATLDLPIKSAVTMMLERHISSLPVVEDGRLKGILTTTDLSLALQCAIQLLESPVSICTDAANHTPAVAARPGSTSSFAAKEPH